MLDLYEWEAEFTEVYLQGSLLRDLDLKIGRQVVNWGTGETFRVVDVLNPLDNREPGLVDIEDLRLPVVMTKLDYYFGDWDLSLIAVHERRFSDDPVFGSDFFPPRWVSDCRIRSRRRLSPIPNRPSPSAASSRVGIWASSRLVTTRTCPASSFRASTR